MDIKKEYERWLANVTADADVAAELKTLDDTKIEDAFYRDLAFGTGGLRGVIGAGTNRMNIYTVAKASQGLADYLQKNFAEPSVAIGYDSRIKSDVFAKVAADVFAANGVKVNIWPVLMPVPTVSFATRYLHTSAGVMVTASHNPSKYNGYKVYGADGCQITTEAAAEILAEIEKLDIFADVKHSDFETGLANGSIKYIPDEVYTTFVNEVKNQSVLFGEEVNKDVAIVYSPLNGTGLKPVTRTLKEMGYTNITVVKEQEQPDGNFSTCPYPNPEIKEAMALGMEYAKKCNADLLLATDPDCDRVGIAVKNKAGEYELLTGNQTGMLLLDYICSQRVKHGKMPADPVMVKTIVTMDMGEQIASHYGLRTINVLTGFKFIGEQIGKLEKQGNAKLIACGEMVKKNLVDYFGFNASQVTVIHNAIEKFDDEVVVDKTLKKLKEDGFYLVGNVGRFAEQKGMEYFIKSYPLIKKKTDRIKYILIGDGVDREKLESLVNQLGIQEEVIFLGFRRDVQNVLSQVDLLVLSSLWEGLPLTPIEGFSVGKTVVATAVDGTVEVVDDSKNGYLIPAKNSEKIAEKVLYLFENPETQKQLEREAYRTFQNEFSFEKFSEKVLNYYEKC